MRGFASELQRILRQVRRQPSIALALVMVLTLTIGANCMIFGIVEPVLFQPLPYENSGRLMMLWQDNPEEGFFHNTVSYPTFEDWRRTFRSFEYLSAYAPQEATLSGEGYPEQVAAIRVSYEFFPVLGVEPIRGRTFTPEEEGAAAIKVAVLSEGLWKRRFAAREGILGERLRIDGEEYTIIGVSPPGFHAPLRRLLGDVDIWLPLRRSSLTADRGKRYLQVIGRLEAEASIEEARDELEAVSLSLAREHAESRGWTARFGPLREEVVGDVRGVLAIILTAGYLLWIVGSANMLSLLLANVSARGEETALRIALGATRRRLARQLFLETLVLALPGGILGFFLTRLGAGLLRSTFGDVLPRGAEIRFATGSLLVALILVFLTALLAALLVSSEAIREYFLTGSTAQIKRFGAKKRRLRRLLVICQVAVAFVLLISAAAFWRSLASLQHTDLGFDARKVIAAEIPLPASRYPELQERSAFFQRLLERMRGLPGARTYGLISDLPLSWWNTGFDFTPMGEGNLKVGGERPFAEFRSVSEDYFRAMGIQLLQGRSFTDGEAQTGEAVWIVSEGLASRYLPGGAVLDRRLAVEYFGRQVVGKIVGVMEDVRHSGPGSEPVATIYAPFRRFPRRQMALVIRGDVAPESLIGALRHTIASLDPELAAADVGLLQARVADALAAPRLRAAVVEAFALVALLLTCFGIYGSVSHAAAQGRYEIGVRLALGARRAEAVGFLLRWALGICFAGVVAGGALAIGAQRLLASQLYGIAVVDPLIVLGVAVLLLTVGLAAASVPAWVAMRMPPSAVLRSGPA